MVMDMTTTAISALVDDSDSRKSFRPGFDVWPFPFSHNLHNSGYFTLGALLQLANRICDKPGRWYIEAGDTQPEAGWSGRGGNRPLKQCIEEIEQANSLVILKRIQEDLEYAPIFNQVRDELSELSGIDIQSRYRDGLMTVLITSPGRITPYHMDGEANLLMQMRATKTVYIFDGKDREILPPAELEGFWSGDVHAPRYKPHLQYRAWRFEISPGQGVSNPVTFPHWVQNGPQVSISLSINFKRMVDDQADAYKLNHQLRTFGICPVEPGSIRLVDHLKGLTYRLAKRVKPSS